MKNNFKDCLNTTLKYEGGYSNHPNDPGGATQRGVTQARYTTYRNDSGLSNRSVRLLTEDEVLDIYRKYYWTVVKGDSLPSGVDLCVFDYAVNSGPSRSAKHLQEILGVERDGQIGPETLKAVHRVDASTLVKALCDRRLRFVKSLRIYKTFGRGWSRRIKGIRKTGLSMVSNAPLSKDNQSLPSGSLLELILTLLRKIFK